MNELTKDVVIYLPELSEIRKYSEAAGNPKALQRNAELGENGIWESPISLKFTVDSFIPEMNQNIETSRLIIRIKNLIGKIDTSLVENQVTSPEFSNIPNVSKSRRAVLLSDKQKERIKQIIHWGILEWIEWEVIYTAMGEEIYLRDTQGKMEPVGILGY